MGVVKFGGCVALTPARALYLSILCSALRLLLVLLRFSVFVGLRVRIGLPWGGTEQMFVFSAVFRLSFDELFSGWRELRTHLFVAPV